MKQNNIRLICKASCRSYIGGRHSGIVYSPARIAIEGVIWTSPTPNDSHECAYINESIDIMTGSIKTEEPQCLTE